MTRHEIQVLRAAGIPERVVAERTAVSVRSVERISHEPPVTGPIRTVRVGRPALTAAWADRVTGWLTENRALPGMELLRRGARSRLSRRQERSLRADPPAAPYADTPRGALGGRAGA